MKTEKVQGALNRLLEMFKTGDFPKAVAKTTIEVRAGYGKPSDKWSLGNRLIMLAAGTQDARGFNQWREVKRCVKKGAKAIYILGPCTRKKIVKVTDPETGEEKEEEKVVVTGFKAIPVFRYEDTEGEPLPEVSYDPPELPPLYDVAKKFGVSVKCLPFKGRAYGYFRPGEIGLHSHDANVFFHELAHAVHNTMKPLKGGQHADQEIVAETVACVLCELYGFQGYIWHGWEYIKHYSSREPQKALKAVMGVLTDVEEVLRRILAVEGEVAAA